MPLFDQQSVTARHPLGERQREERKLFHFQIFSDKKARSAAKTNELEIWRGCEF